MDCGSSLNMQGIFLPKKVNLFYAIYSLCWSLDWIFSIRRGYWSQASWNGKDIIYLSLFCVVSQVFFLFRGFLKRN
jgi:hypothetical protein